MKIRTEDNVELELGARAYNYYDMKPGVITEDELFVSTYERDGEPLNIKRDIWFQFEHDDGSTSLLNGERICSVAFARRRGFSGAE